MAHQLSLIIAERNNKLRVKRHGFHGRAKHFLEPFGAIFLRRHQGLRNLNPRGGFGQFLAKATLIKFGHDGAFQLVTFVEEGKSE